MWKGVLLFLMNWFVDILLLIFLVLFIAPLKYAVRAIEISHWWHYFIELKQKQETKESLDQFSHKHSEHWEYVKDLIPWRIRLRLSRFRGKKWALSWRIKLFAFFAGLGPQVAQWILKEYMITAKVVEQPEAKSDWLCPQCGTYNEDTALFCKDCGEYK